MTTEQDRDERPPGEAPPGEPAAPHPPTVDAADADRGGHESGAPPPFGVFPIIVLLIVIASGIFIVFELRDISKVQDCVWSGRRNCAPVDVGR